MMKLSVIIPVYKVEEYLDECLQSVLREIPEDSEVILVDDCSPDRCPEICDNYSRQDSRIKVIHKENGGLSSARNSGLNIARGEYIYFLDSDDYLEKNYFQYLFSHTADLVIGNFIAFYQDGTADYRIPCETREYHSGRDFLKHFDLYFGTLFNFAWGKLYRRDIIEAGKLRFADGISMTEDVLFNISYYRHCQTVAVDRQAIVKYRQTAGTLSKVYHEKTFLWYLTSYENIKQLLAENSIWTELKDAFYRYFTGNVLECIYGSCRMPESQQLLQEICNNAEVQHAVHCTNLETLRGKSIVWCIRHKKIHLLTATVKLYMLLSKIKHFLGDAMKKLFQKIKNRSRWLLSFPVYRYYKLTWHPPVVHSIEETIQAVLERGASVSRYGDGEFDIMMGKSIPFQVYEHDLAEKMKKILQQKQEDFLVCIPDVFGKKQKFTEKAQEYYKHYLQKNIGKLYCFLRNEKSFYNTFMTRPYMIWSDKADSKSYFLMLKKIWQDRDIVFVEGEKSRLGIGNDLFANAKSIRRILCPAQNAFCCYQETIHEITHLEKNTLILLALGPTATAMAYDLYKQGYQAIDIGHADIEYEWFLIGATQKVAVKNKYTNEATTADGINIGDLNDSVYQSQIIARIGLR